MRDGVVGFTPASLGKNIGQGLAMGGDWFFTSHTASDKSKLEVKGKKKESLPLDCKTVVFGRFRKARSSLVKRASLARPY